MTTVEAALSLVQWLNADWTHVIVLAAAIAALTPTPKPGTWYAKAYRVLDVMALNIIHAKSTGIPPAAIAEQVVALLATKSEVAPAISGESASPKE